MQQYKEGISLTLPFDCCRLAETFVAGDMILVKAIYEPKREYTTFFSKCSFAGIAASGYADKSV